MYMWCKVFRGTKCNLIIWSDVGDMVFPGKIFIDKNVLTTGLNFACLEIRSRNEEAINSTAFTRWGFFTSYFIDVDTFYLFLNWFSTRVSDDRKYVCGRRLYACINTRKFKGLDSREITSLPEIKKVIYMARHFNHRRK